MQHLEAAGLHLAQQCAVDVGHHETGPLRGAVGVGQQGEGLVVGGVCALGLEVQELFPPRESHGRPLKRRALLSAQQCLDVIAFETMLVGTAAFNLANGHALTSDDLQRLGVACGRIQALATEVRA